MDLEAFRLMWKGILQDEGISERELWRRLSLPQQNYNRKLNKGTISFIEFTNILEHMGYKINFKKY